jgi:hypothetical protein
VGASLLAKAATRSQAQGNFNVGIAPDQRYTNVEKGLTLHRYWSSKCRGCAMKPQCTPSPERRVRRWEHEAVQEEMQDRLSNAAATRPFDGQVIDGVLAGTVGTHRLSQKHCSKARWRPTWSYRAASHKTKTSSLPLADQITSIGKGGCQEKWAR